MAVNWRDDRNKRTWATAGLKAEIKQLRKMANRTRKRFANNGIWGDPAYWAANAYDEAADKLQDCIKQLEAKHAEAGNRTA